MAAVDANVTCTVATNVDATYPPAGSVTTNLASRDVSQSAPVNMPALSFGTASGLVDLVSCTDRTLTAGANETLDLYVGTDLPDLDGLTCAFRTVRFFQVSIVSGGDASGLRVGGAASNAWGGFFADVSDKYDIFPSGPPLLGGSPAGKAVGATTKNLKVENLGAVSVTYRVTIGGGSV